MSERKSQLARRGGREALARILLASDLTARSDRAFDRSVMLARAHRAALRVLHVVDSSLLLPQFARQERREAKIGLEHAIAEAGADKVCDVSAAAASGDDVSKAIVDYADSMHSDLLIMGAADYSKASAAFRGTTVDRVIRAANCPVVAVKTRPRHVYRSIVAGFDGGAASRHALGFALRTFPRAKFTVIHIDETSRAKTHVRKTKHFDRGVRHPVEETVRTLCEDAGVAGPGAAGGPTFRIIGGRAHATLEAEIQRLSPDLVVLGTHGRTGMAKLFLGSVAESLLAKLPFDMLVAQARPHLATLDNEGSLS